MKGFTMSVVLDDLLLLSRYMGVSSGRWEENEQTRPDTVSKQIAFITKMADKHDFKLSFDDCGEIISEGDFWALNITLDNHVLADRISFRMYHDLENHLKAKLHREISKQ